MKIRRVRILIAVFFIWFILWHLGAFRFFSLAGMQYLSMQVHAWVTQNTVMARIVFCMAYIVAVALSFPSASVLTLLAGYLFGFWWGSVLAVFSATIGAILSFLMMRIFFKDAVQAWYGARLSEINAAIDRDGIWYMLFARLVAIIPFFLANAAAALSSLPLWDFTWTTAIGIIPGSMVYAYAGRQLHQISSLADIFSTPIIILFLLLALFALLPILIKRYCIK